MTGPRCAWCRQCEDLLPVAVGEDGPVHACTPCRERNGLEPLPAGPLAIRGPVCEWCDGRNGVREVVDPQGHDGHACAGCRRQHRLESALPRDRAIGLLRNLCEAKRQMDAALAVSGIDLSGAVEPAEPEALARLAKVLIEAGERMVAAAVRAAEAGQ